MLIEFKAENDVVILRPREDFLGEESIDDLTEGYEKAAGLDPKAVIVDLENVKRIDSVGLFSLIKGYRYLGEACRIHLCNVTPELISVLERIRYHEVFDIDESLESALNSIT